MVKDSRVRVTNRVRLRVMVKVRVRFWVIDRLTAFLRVSNEWVWRNYINVRVKV